MRLGTIGGPQTITLDYNDTIRANVLIDRNVPGPAVRAFARVLAEAMAQSTNGEGVLPKLLPVLVLNKRRYGNRKESYADRIIRHCDMWLRRDFKGLQEDVKQCTSKTKPLRDLSREDMVTKKVETGQTSPAMNALKSNGIADPEDPAVQDRMDAKHPNGPDIPTPPNLPSAAALHITAKEAKKLLKSLERGKSSGPSRLTNEMIRQACLNKSEEGDGALLSLITYINTYIDGNFDKSQAPFINAARLIAYISPKSRRRTTRGPLRSARYSDAWSAATWRASTA
jgi:hypothetical protein